MATYTFRHEEAEARRGTVTVSQVPPEFLKALDAQWEIVQKRNFQIVPVIEFANAREVADHLSYAKAWARMKNEGKEVTVRKGTKRNDDKDSTLRIVMERYDENAVKRGRKPGTATASA